MYCMKIISLMGIIIFPRDINLQIKVNISPRWDTLKTKIVLLFRQWPIILVKIEFYVTAF